MNFYLIILSVTLLLASESHSENTTNKPNSSNSKEWNCEDLDFCDDKSGFEAIRWLHHQLDDDANGNVDISESDEFLRDELHYENANDRHRNFHGNDKHISVDELWKSWKVSEVHNWTVDETLDWLSTSLELPQYVDIFLNNNVDGTTLPRLTNHQFISTLGIKDPIHRQKISLKAMDVVLFGPPKMHNYMKDIILVISCIIAIGGLWHAVITNRYSRKHLKKMLKDMDSLQKAEEQLQELQRELDKAKEQQQIVTMEKAHLEEMLNSEIDSRSGFQREGSLSNFNDFNRVLELEEELRNAKEQLTRAETALINKSWAPPHKLQLWLQLTHELELQHYNAKRQAAEMQLIAAKEGCEKLKKKRSSFLGSFKVAHGSSIDDVDNRILLAKTALSDITKDLKERLYRWQQIEELCGFQIVNNRGFLHIQAELYSCYPKNSVGSNDGPSLTRNNSENTIQEVDCDSFDYIKSTNTNRSLSLQKTVRPVLSSDISSMISLPTTSTSSSLHHRNQVSNGQAQINGDETNSSGDSNNGDEDEHNKNTRPTFILGDCPTIPENSQYMEITRKRPVERKRKEGVTMLTSNETNHLVNGKSTEIVLRHRAFTKISSEDTTSGESNHGDTSLEIKDNLGQEQHQQEQLQSQQLQQQSPQALKSPTLEQSTRSCSTTNLEEKGYSSGSETPPVIKKKVSRTGIKFFNKLRKRKSLPEKDFTSFIKSME